MRRSPLPLFCRRPGAAAQHRPRRAQPSCQLILPIVGLAALLALAGPWPAAGQPAPDRLAAIARALENGASFLCAECDNDIEAEGVNRPARRSILAGADVQRAEDLALDAAAQGAPEAAAVLVEIRAVREALDSQEEAEALAAIRRALMLLGR